MTVQTAWWINVLFVLNNASAIANEDARGATLMFSRLKKNIYIYIYIIIIII